MRSYYFTKPVRTKIAKAIAAEIASIFGVPVPVVGYLDNPIFAEDCRTADDVHVRGATGAIRLSISVSPRMVTVFGRLRSNERGPCTPAEDDLYRLLNGFGWGRSSGGTNGKVNCHISPSATHANRAEDADKIVAEVRSHLLILKNAGYGEGKAA